MHWIRNDKRLALYQRDGFRCAYCCRTAAAGVRLSLDHLEADGGNDETNLITCCLSCNAARGLMPWREFAKDDATRQYIEKQRLLPFRWTAAKAALAEWGFSGAVERWGQWAA